MSADGTAEPGRDPERGRVEARLRKWSADATADFKRVFGVAAESGTLGACKRILTPNPEDPNGWVSVLTPIWEAGRLEMTVEAAALNPEFLSLFTDTERAIARQRLGKFGHEVK